MTSHLTELLAVAGEAESTALPIIGNVATAKRVSELIELLNRKNGFYAFDAALHVFPADLNHGGQELNAWNTPDLWRSAYGKLAEGCFFFAEDIFGGQFCVWREGVYSFDPETGDKELIGRSIQEWAGAVLTDPENLTGYPLARAWQRRNGPVHKGMRLVPKQPFVLGGAFAVENLYALEAEKSMRFRGELALQLLDLPDGATVRMRTVE